MTGGIRLKGKQNVQDMYVALLRIHHLGSFNKPSLTPWPWMRQWRIISKKPLQGSSGLANSFRWSNNILINYFLFVTNTPLRYCTMRSIYNLSLHPGDFRELSPKAGGQAHFKIFTLTEQETSTFWKYFLPSYSSGHHSWVSNCIWISEQPSRTKHVCTHVWPRRGLPSEFCLWRWGCPEALRSGQLSGEGGRRSQHWKRYSFFHQAPWRRANRPVMLVHGNK